MVIADISPEAVAQLQAYCAKQGLDPSSFLSGLVTSAVTVEPSDTMHAVIAGTAAAVAEIKSSRDQFRDSAIRLANRVQVLEALLRDAPPLYSQDLRNAYAQWFGRKETILAVSPATA